MNDKGLYIIIAAVFFSPLALLFYIEWYWVFLIYNIFWAVLSYAARSETKNPKIVEIFPPDTFKIDTPDINKSPAVNVVPF